MQRIAGKVTETKFIDIKPLRKTAKTWKSRNKRQQAQRQDQKTDPGRNTSKERREREKKKKEKDIIIEEPSIVPGHHTVKCIKPNVKKASE